MQVTRVEARIQRSAFTFGAGPTSTGGNLHLRSMDTLLVRVETDDGLHGWGEGFGFSLCETTRDAVERLVGPACIGADAADIAGTTHMLQRRFHNYGRNGPVSFAISAIDTALWDIAARAASRPMHALLGDAGRKRVPAYASLLRYGVPDDVARNTAEAVRRGYKQIKLHEVDLDCIRAARAVAPAEIPLMLDINCAWNSAAEAIAFCKAVAGMNIRWVEEPVWPPEAIDTIAAIRAEAGCGIAAGENLGSPDDFRRMLAAKAVDIAQPSVTKVGGVSAMLEVAAMARAAGVAMAPHCPYCGPGLLASLHLLAAVPENEPIEIYFADLTDHPYGTALTPVDGYITVPQGPLEPA